MTAPSDPFRDAHDARDRQPIIDAIDQAYREANPDQSVPWTPLAFVRLKHEVERFPLTVSEWIEAVRNRFASDVAHAGELPETFIPYLSRHAVIQNGKNNAGEFAFSCSSVLSNASIKITTFPETGNMRGKTKMAIIRKKEAKKGTAAVAKKPKRGRPSKKDAAVNEAANVPVETGVKVAEEVKEAPVTAIERVPPVVVLAPGADGYSKTFQREAQRLDEKIVKTLDRMQKDVTVLGEYFDEMHTKGYHRALGYSRFEDYLRNRFPDALSKSQVFQAMRIVRELTAGDNPAVSKEDVREMPKDNAEGLAKLKKAGHKITPQLIEDAKTLPIKRFQEEIVLPMTPERGGRAAADVDNSLAPAIEPEQEVLVRRTFTLSGAVNSRLSKAVEIAKYLTRDAEADRRESFDDRVINAIVAEFLSTYEADYAALMSQQERESQHAAQVTEDAIGPEVPEDEANEYRAATGEGQDAEENAATDERAPELEVESEVNEYQR
jgi:hypothetical protein